MRVFCLRMCEALGALNIPLCFPSLTRETGRVFTSLGSCLICACARLLHVQLVLMYVELRAFPEGVFCPPFPSVAKKTTPTPPQNSPEIWVQTFHLKPTSSLHLVFPRGELVAAHTLSLV